MNPRVLLATLFGGARGALESGRLLTRHELLALASAVQAWCGRLLLPLLTPEQRVQMARGDLPGLAGLALTLRDFLLSRTDFQAALDMSAEVFEALRQKGLELLTICERAGDIVDAATGGQAAVLEHLEQLCAQIGDTAARLRDAGSTPEADRGVIAGCLDGLDCYEERRGEKKDTRKARTRRALASLREGVARAQARRTLARLSTAVLQNAGVAGDDAPRTALTLGPAPEADGPLSTGGPARRPASPRRRTPEAGALAEPQGAPLDRCLDSPLEQFIACAAELQRTHEQLQGMGLSPREPRSADSLGALELCDKALVLAQALRTSALLQKECGVSPERLEALCGLWGALSTVQEAAERLLRGAQDGWLAFGYLVLLGCQQAETWAAARARQGLDEAERGRLQVELADLREALRRAGEPGRRQQARAQQRASALARELETAQAEDRAGAVVEKLRAGEAVGAAELQATAELQRRKVARDAAALTAAAPAKGRRRPR